MTRKIYWHFVAESGKLGYKDGRVVKPRKKYTVDCEPVLCTSGLHASARLIDALQYAPGPILCKVRLGGEVVHGDDKSVATERTVVAMADVTDILRAFARKTAADVWYKEFKRGQYPAVDLWLDRGEEKDRSAARSAAESAAWSAAESAAWSAAESAAESAARSAANKRLLAMVRKAEWES